MEERNRASEGPPRAVKPQEEEFSDPDKKLRVFIFDRLLLVFFWIFGAFFLCFTEPQNPNSIVLDTTNHYVMSTIGIHFSRMNLYHYYFPYILTKEIIKILPTKYFEIYSYILSRRILISS